MEHRRRCRRGRLGDLYLVRILGVRGTALLAGTLSLLTAVMATRLSTAGRSTPIRKNRFRRDFPRSAGRPWLAASFLSGFCLLALEVGWFRLLLLFVMGHSTAFAVMLAVVLTGIAAADWSRRCGCASHRTPIVGRPQLVLAAGILSIVSYAAFPAIVTPFETHQIDRITEILESAGRSCFRCPWSQG